MKPRPGNIKDLRLLSAVVNTYPHILAEFEEKWVEIKLQVDPQALSALEEIKIAFLDMYVTAYTSGVAFNCDFIAATLRKYVNARTFPG